MDIYMAGDKVTMVN